MRGILSFLVILVLASGAMAAFMDYQGGSTVMTAADWYEMNVTWDPTSTSGAPRWPAIGDAISLRNGTVTQLNTFVQANELQIGGYAVLDTSGGVKQPMPASTWEILAGGTLSINQGLTIADEYDGTMNMYEGSRLEIDESAVGDGKSWWRVGYNTGLTGQMNIYGGTVIQDSSAGSYSNLYIGKKGTGEVHQYGGLVDIHGGTTSYVFCGRESGAGTGSYILEGGSFRNSTDANNSRTYAGRYGGTGIWIQTGGYSWFGGHLDVGTSGDTQGYANGYASFLGGTTQMFGSIWFGSTHSTLGTPVGGGRITFGQDAVFQAGGTITAGSDACELEFIIGSAADFDVYLAGLLSMNRLDVVVTLDGGYTPTNGQQWVAIMANGGVDLTGIQTVTTNWLVIDDTVNDYLILEYIPEPATLSLLALGGLALIRRRR